MFETTSDIANDCHGTPRGDQLDLVLIHNEGGRQHTQEEGSGKADTEWPAKSDDTYVAHMGLVQLFVKVNNSPGDDFFTDPVGCGTTGPLLLYSDGDDEETDREESEAEDEDSDEEYWGELVDWDKGLGGLGWSRKDDPPREEDEDTHDTPRFTTDPMVDINDRRVTAFGQSASHAETLLTRQFRTCLFSISVSGRFVRFLRWDREGVIVSEAIDYKADPMPLATLVWAFTSASDSRRGWDTSAKPSYDPKDEELFRTKVTKHVMRQLSMKGTDPNLANKVEEHYQEKVITKLLVPSVGLEGPLRILVSRPCFVSPSPTGPSMRGYWGVVFKETTQDSDVVFVKDVWRSNVEGAEREVIPCTTSTSREGGTSRRLLPTEMSRLMVSSMRVTTSLPH